MTIEDRKNIIIEDLKDKKYRDAFVEANINVGVPSQIRALRKQRKWSQEDLAKETNKKQESISRIEDPSRFSLNIKTLKELASAFDVGLIVRFVPFSELVEWKLNLSLNSYEVVSFTEEPYFKTDNTFQFMEAHLIEDNKCAIYDINIYREELTRVDLKGYEPQLAQQAI